MPRIRAVFGLVLALAIAPTVDAAENDNQARTGEAAFGDWSSDAPGVRRSFKPDDMPAAGATRSARNSPAKVRMPSGAKPRVPEGFSVEMVASGLSAPRVIRVAPNGDLFVADSGANEVRVFRVPGGSAKPAEDEVFASGLNRPYGIAFYPTEGDPQWVYIANTDGIVRFPYKDGDLKASGDGETIVEGIPTSRHWTRDIVFSANGERLFFSVGSGSNVAENMNREPPGGLDEWAKTQPLGATWGNDERRGDVLSFDPDGKNEKIFATGLRNCSGMAIEPETENLWCVVNERDGLGDDVPFEYATWVEEGAFYGWPWYYIGENEDPRHKGARPDLANEVRIPDVLFQAHSAPLNIAFYEGTNFPEEYRGDAFVTFHGSWNRGKPTGYKVVRVLFENGKPTGEYEDFMTGFVISDEEVWGRPVGVAVGKDGSLFVTEDGSGTIWRVTHESKGSS